MFRTPTAKTHPGLRDAVEPFKFSVVYKNDVKGSVVGSLTQCAGACALKRQFPEAITVWITKSRTFVELKDGSIIRYQNPAMLSHAVESFDRGAGMFPPGDYVLRVPRDSELLGVRQRDDGRPQHRKGSGIYTVPFRPRKPAYGLRD